VGRAGGTARFLATLCAASGAFIVLLYLGVVPWRRVGRCRALLCDPYHWQVLCFGVAFAAAGALFLIPPRLAPLGRLVALLAVASFAAALGGALLAR
jgi:hypothetical protein